MKKPATIHDIARVANVSSATVSRVLSNSAYPVKKVTRTKVEKVARELNYIPNLLGKQLKDNRNTTIGVIIPTILNPFYSSVLFGIEEIARQNQFTVITCNSLHDSDLEEEYIRKMAEKQVKALIISSISQNKSQLKQLIENGVKVIAIDQTIKTEQVSQVEFDYYKGSIMAMEYLLSKGHEKIAYVTAKLDRPSRISLHKGYMETMKCAGYKPLVMELDHEDMYSRTNEFEMGKKLALKVLASNEKPTAVFACNDMIAVGVINELGQQGLRVPDDVSVMGFDGIDFGQMITPQLTTIKQPDYEMGKMSCKMLLDMLGEETPEFNIMLQPKLVERLSVRKI